MMVTITLNDEQDDAVLTQTGAKQQIADLQAQVTAVAQERDAAVTAQLKAEGEIAAIKASIAQAGY